MEKVYKYSGYRIDSMRFRIITLLIVVMVLGYIALKPESKENKIVVIDGSSTVYLITEAIKVVP